MRATVRYLATTVGAVVEELHDDGRRLTVLTDDGQHLEFTLRLATGQYHASGDGPRLVLDP
ncbi:MAG TPA: hypothetical protein VII98_15605 [Solirubrobacteraceae bacterium]